MTPNWLEHFCFLFVFVADFCVIGEFRERNLRLSRYMSYSLCIMSSVCLERAERKHVWDCSVRGLAVLQIICPMAVGPAVC